LPFSVFIHLIFAIIPTYKLLIFYFMLAQSSIIQAFC
jgi:hypothetical protein